MNKSSSKQVWRWITCVVIVAVIVIICRRIAPVNPTTVALIFLVAVLVVSAFWGLQYSVLVAVLATLA